MWAISTRPQSAIPINAKLPKSAIIGFLTIAIVVFGDAKSAILRNICPKKTPVANPNTLIILKSGIYPAKSSRPKMRGMVREKKRSERNVLCMPFCVFDCGITNLRRGEKRIFTFCKICKK